MNGEDTSFGSLYKTLLSTENRHLDIRTRITMLRERGSGMLFVVDATRRSDDHGQSWAWSPAPIPILTRDEASAVSQFSLDLPD